MMKDGGFADTGGCGYAVFGMTLHPIRNSIPSAGMVDYETRVGRASQLSGCTNNAEVESVFDSESPTRKMTETAAAGTNERRSWR
jgi:hypothetical protein